MNTTHPRRVDWLSLLFWLFIVLSCTALILVAGIVVTGLWLYLTGGL